MQHDPPTSDSLTQRLPLPLAQLYRRAQNAKSVADRHVNAFYLWEAALKLLGAVAVVEYARQTEHDPKLAECLKNLARPSLGHWREFVRRLVPALADAKDADFAKLRDGLERSCDDLPRCAGLLALLSEATGGRAGARATASPAEVFDAIVAYRNLEFGHGAAGKRGADFYDRMGRALLVAAAELFDRLNLLVGRRLIFVSEVRKSRDLWLVHRFELMGESAQRLESLDRRGDDLNEERVYLDSTHYTPCDEGVITRSVMSTFTSLYPLAVFELETDRFGFLNDRKGKAKAEFLCYTTGERFTEADLGAEQRTLLARALGLPEVSEQQLHGWAAETSAYEDDGEIVAANRRTLGEFELISELGRGGMGIVYRAWQPSLRRQVALKCLARPGDVKAEARFRREIRALGQVEHPHVVKVFTSGAEGEQWFYVMELVEGAPLSAICEKLSAAGSTDVDLPAWKAAVSTVVGECRRNEKPISDAPPVESIPPSEAEAPQAPHSGSRGYIRQIVELMQQMADATQALHDHGVIHRDIKPGNIQVSPDGDRATLMDLGLAQIADDQDGKLTRTRQFVGTLRYASPEQVLAVRKVSVRSDVYSLGATLWECLTLRPLFGATDDTPTPELMEKIQRDEPQRLRTLQPNLSRDLEAIVHKCLEKKDSDRYDTAAHLAGDLRRYLAGEPVTARKVSGTVRTLRWLKRRPAIAAVLVLVGAFLSTLIIGLSMMFLQSERSRKDIETEQLKTSAALAQAQIDRDAAQFESYVANLILIDAEFLAKDMARVRKRLDACPKRLRNWEWHYLNARADPSLNVIGGDGNFVSAAAISPRGDSIVFSGDGLRICDVKSGTMLLIPEDKRHANSIAFDSAGKRIVTSYYDGSARVWDAATGKRITQLRGHQSQIRSARFSPMGDRLVTASSDKTVRLWDAESGKEVARFRGHDDQVFSAAFSSTGDRLVTASLDKTIRVWDTETGNQLLQFRGDDKGFISAKFDPLDARVISVSLFENSVSLWEVATGKEIGKLRGHTGQVWSAAFSPNGNRIVTASNDRTVRIWDSITAKELAVLRAHENPVISAEFTETSNHVITVDEGGTTRVWDSFTQPAIAPSFKTARTAKAAVFSPTGDQIVITSTDLTARVLDTLTGKELFQLRNHFYKVVAAAFSPTSDRIYTAPDSNYPKVWDAATGKLIREIRGQNYGTILSAFSSNGEHMVITPQNDPRNFAARVRVTATGKELAVFRGHEQVVNSAAFDVGGNLVVTASDDRTARVWNAGTGIELVVLRGHDGPVRSAAFSSSGNRVVTASFDKTARVWNTETGKQLAVLRGHEDRVWSAAFNAAGDRIVTASSDNTARVWDTTTGTELVALRGSERIELNDAKESMLFAAFSPNSDRIVTVSSNGIVQIWDSVPYRDRYPAILAARAAEKTMNDRLTPRFQAGEDLDQIVQSLVADQAIDDLHRRAGLAVIMEERRRREKTPK